MPVAFFLVFPSSVLLYCFLPYSKTISTYLVKHMCVCTCIHTHAQCHDAHVETRGSQFLPFIICDLGMDLGYQTWWQMPLLTKSFRQLSGSCLRLAIYWIQWGNHIATWVLPSEIRISSVSASPKSAKSGPTFILITPWIFVSVKA